MQGTQIRFLGLDDSTCWGATKPQLLKPAHLEPLLHNKRSLRSEKPAHHREGEPPLTAARESPQASVKTHRRQK